jgi:hypothetical protein
MELFVMTTKLNHWVVTDQATRACSVVLASAWLNSLQSAGMMFLGIPLHYWPPCIHESRNVQVPANRWVHRTGENAFLACVLVRQAEHSQPCGVGGVEYSML